MGLLVKTFEILLLIYTIFLLICVNSIVKSSITDTFIFTMVKLLNIGNHKNLIRRSALILSVLYLVMVVAGSFLLPRASDITGTNNAHHSKITTTSIAKINRFMRRERVVIQNRKQFIIKVVVSLFVLQFLVSLTRKLHHEQSHTLLKTFWYNYLMLRCLRL